MNNNPFDSDTLEFNCCCQDYVVDISPNSEITCKKVCTISLCMWPNFSYLWNPTSDNFNVYQREDSEYAIKFDSTFLYFIMIFCYGCKFLTMVVLIILGIISLVLLATLFFPITTCIVVIICICAAYNQDGYQKFDTQIINNDDCDNDYNEEEDLTNLMTGSIIMNPSGINNEDL